MTSNKIEVFIVDDSATVRKVLKDVLSYDPEIEVIGTHHNPVVALKYLPEHRPDVIITDIDMPEMDGLEFIQKVMSSDDPIPMLVVSAFTPQGSETAVKAMAYGAIDVIEKPKVNTAAALKEAAQTLIPLVKSAAKAPVRRRRTAPSKTTPLKAPAKRYSIDDILPAGHCTKVSSFPVIAIGSSTGGTSVIESIIQNLPTNTPPIVIAQHMPAAFTPAFAKRLNEMSEITVEEVSKDEVLKPGHAYLAPGGEHIVVEQCGANICVKLKDAPPVNRFKPSVDILFRSVAQCVGSAGIGVILTGLGDDGALGMLDLHKAKAVTLGQDEASCAVFGMPKAANELGAIQKLLSPEEIAQTLLDYTKYRRTASL